MALSPHNRMTQQTKIYVGVIAAVFVLLIIAIVLFFLSRKKKNDDAHVAIQDVKATAGNSNVVVGPLPAAPKQNSPQDLNKVLKKGMSTPEVGTLQTILNLKGYNLSVDDSFGQKTEDALFALTTKKQTSINEMSSYVAGLGGMSGTGTSLFSWFR